MADSLRQFIACIGKVQSKLQQIFQQEERIQRMDAQLLALPPAQQQQHHQERADIVAEVKKIAPALSSCLRTRLNVLHVC